MSAYKNGLIKYDKQYYKETLEKYFNVNLDI